MTGGTLTLLVAADPEAAQHLNASADSKDMAGTKATDVYLDQAAAGVRPQPVGVGASTWRGTAPVSFSMKHMTLWPGSAVGENMSGQPPGMTATPWLRPYSAAGSDMLPSPKARCSHTRPMPASMQSLITASATSGVVPITTPSTPPGIDLTSW